MLKSSFEIIKDGWKIYVKNWRRFALFLILLLLPAIFISATDAISSYLKIFFPKLPFIGNVVILAIFIVAIILAFLAATALMRAVITTDNTQSVDWKKFSVAPGNLVWMVVWASLMVGLVSFSGDLLLTIFILMFAALYNFIFYTVIFENANGFGALRVSYALIAGRAGALLWRLVMSAVVLTIFIFVISYILTFVIRILPLPIFLELFLAKIIPSLAKTAIIPLLARSTLILYQSAKQNPIGPTVQPISL